MFLKKCNSTELPFNSLFGRWATTDGILHCYLAYMRLLIGNITDMNIMKRVLEARTNFATSTRDH